MSSSGPSPRLPNILITGTPGSGKTSLSSRVSSLLSSTPYPLQHIELGQLIKEKGLHDEWDDEYDTYILNEDKVCDELEPLCGEQGGYIVDYHSADFFPERWFQLIIVLRVDNSILFDRLSKRGYGEKKISENIECEIMQVCEDQARESYAGEIVTVLTSNTVEEQEENAVRTVEWVKNYMKNNRK